MRSLAPHLLLTAVTGMLLAACSSCAPKRSAMPGPSDVVITVGTVSITLSEVDARALQNPAGGFGNVTLSQAVYEARRAAASEIITNLLLDQGAKRQHTDRASMYAQEITAKARPVTDADVAAWYDANREQVEGAALDQVRGPIQALLTQLRLQDARNAYIQAARATTAIQLMIEPARVAISGGGSPARGPANAPVEFIEFADFQCPYCRAASPAVKQVLDAYGDRVKFVYRNFPLNIHPDARPAAEAAQCAHEQGKFWAYHDRLYGDDGKLSAGDLKQAAAALQMDMPRFNACVDQRKYGSVVDADLKAGAEAGVAGTPAFFINGRFLSGAQPFTAFKQIIDEELEFKKR